MSDLKDLNLTKEQMEKLQEQLKDVLKDGVEPDWRMAALFSSIDSVRLFVEADKPETYVQFKDPKLHKFMVVRNGDAMGCSDCERFDRENRKDLARWDVDKVYEVNLVKESDAEQFGKFQIDETTGECYMMLPIDISLLIRGVSLSSEKSTALKREPGPGPTFYLYDLDDQPEKVADLDDHSLDPSQEALDDHPQEVGSQEASDEHPQEGSQKDLDQKANINQDESVDDEPVEPEEQFYWEFASHVFEMPKTCFPFEVSFDSEGDRMSGGADDLEAQELPTDDDLENTDGYLSEAVQVMDDLYKYLDNLDD
ncbi:uncharacterized protein LOC108105340 [Drosophila eugracilis]|uniref:uncharacterized protein LOC108105340 n=1 Tax=Drosophila eugracilis TaxID=29029 RepID=UPI0007E70102|nr:uncharacterized protein LOC108105340 [Drosophila eugracilis]XP_017067324.1 uncharacterized protein LOC108105340 [Drosophila eugracilis]XP_017067325.1 uncharacterized protein LOC108105340 [Drosophila eugracilis]